MWKNEEGDGEKKREIGNKGRLVEKRLKDFFNKKHKKDHHGKDIGDEKNDSGKIFG